jgi:hypothetical protein
MNKKGKGEKVMVIPWMLGLLVIAFAIAWIVNMFYGAPYDIREIESRLLLNKVADCISYAGRMDNTLISKTGINSEYKDFLESCYLNFNSEWEIEPYFVKVEIYKSEDLVSPLIILTKGYEDLEAECLLKEEVEYRLSSKCSKNTFISLDETNKEYTIKILSAVKKLEKNVKE